MTNKVDDARSEMENHLAEEGGGVTGDSVLNRRRARRALMMFTDDEIVESFIDKHDESIPGHVLDTLEDVRRYMHCVYGWVRGVHTRVRCPSLWTADTLDVLSYEVDDDGFIPARSMKRAVPGTPELHVDSRWANVAMVLGCVRDKEPQVAKRVDDATVAHKPEVASANDAPDPEEIGGPLYPAVVVRLEGEDSKGLAILGRAKRACSEAGIASDVFGCYHREAMSDYSYPKLIATTARYFTTDPD